MSLVKNEEIKNTVTGLWKQYLLTAVADDILMGEISDHLYVENIDFQGLAAKKGENYLASVVADTAFGDTIEDAVSQLVYDREEMKPYSELLDFMEPEELIERILSCISMHIARYSPESVTENPYFKHVRVRGRAECGHISLTENDYLPGEFIQTYNGTFRRNDPFSTCAAGYFDGKVRFPVLLEDGNVWMSIVLSEIQSMALPVEKTSGKVITYGLGLGYYVYMVSSKPDVESVTVIEKNPDVISLFRKKLLPQFPNKEKVQIIEDDAFDFIRKQKDGEFNYAFSDFWGGFYDGLELYLRFASETAGFVNTVHDYWIESCFADLFFRPAVMQFLMEDILERKVRITDQGKKVRRIQKNFIDFLCNEQLSFGNTDEIVKLLDYSSLIPLMRKFAVYCRHR